MKIDRFLSSNKVQFITGKSRVTLWRWCNSGDFPKPYRFGPNSVGWLESDILEWQSQFKSEDMEASNDEKK